MASGRGLFRHPPYIAVHHKRRRLLKGTQDVSAALIDQTAVISAPTVGRAVYPARIERITRATSTFYSEPFNGSSLSGDWTEYAFNDIPVTVAGGNLVVTFASGGFWGQIDAASNRNLTGRILSLEITQIDDGMGLRLGSQTSPDFYDESDVYVHRVGSDYFVAARNPGFDFTSVNLGATLPERIQIREQGGVWHYGYVVGGVLAEFETFEGNAGFPTAVKVFIAGFSTGEVATVDGAVASTSGFTIYESDQIFGPTVTAVATVTVALIDQTAVAFDPTVETEAAILDVGLIDQTAATFTPTVTPGAVSVLLGLIDQTATIAAPSISLTIFPNFINQTAVIHAATVSTLNAISVGLINQTASASTPTVTPGAAPVTVGLINQTAQIGTPTITTGAVNVSVNLIDQTATIHALTVSQQQFVVLGLISQSAATFDPTVTTGAITISVGLINQTAVIHAATVTTANAIVLDLIDQTATIHAPSVELIQSILLALIDQTATAQTPTVSVGAVEASVGIIDQTAQPRTPTVTTANAISVGLIDQTASPFAPTTTTANSITVARINQTASATAPSVQRGAVNIDLGLISQPAATFTPSVTATASISVGRIEQAAVIFEMTLATTGTQDIEPGLIDQTAVAHAPAITQPSLRRRVGGGGVWMEPRVLEQDRDPHWMAPWPQFVGFLTIAVNTEVFSPDVALSDDELIFGLTDEDLLVLA